MSGGRNMVGAQSSSWVFHEEDCAVDRYPGESTQSRAMKELIAWTRTTQILTDIVEMMEIVSKTECSRDLPSSSWKTPFRSWRWKSWRCFLVLREGSTELVETVIDIP